MSQAAPATKTTVVNAGPTQIIHSNPAAAPVNPLAGQPIVTTGSAVRGTTAGVIFSSDGK